MLLTHTPTPTHTLLEITEPSETAASNLIWAGLSHGSLKETIYGIFSPKRPPPTTDRKYKVPERNQEVNVTKTMSDVDLRKNATHYISTPRLNTPQKLGLFI